MESQVCELWYGSAAGDGLPATIVPGRPGDGGGNFTTMIGALEQSRPSSTEPGAWELQDRNGLSGTGGPLMAGSRAALNTVQVQPVIHTSNLYQ